MSKIDFSTPRARVGRRIAVMVSVLAMVLGMVLLGTATPALASLSSVSVGAQSGTLTYGTAGSATFSVTVTRTATTPASFSLSASGLPAGASATFSVANPIGFVGTAASRTVTMTVNTLASTPAGPDSFNVQASGTGPDPTGTGTLTIGKANQTITFAALANKAFGDPDFNVSATTTSGLTVGFAAAGNCTATGTLVHLTGAGSCTITASQAGNGNYNAAASVPRTFAIAQGDQTITFGALADRNIFSPDFALTATASSGLAVTYAASGVCTVAGDLVHLTGAAGSCTITASQAGDANWNAATDVLQDFDVISVTPTADLYAVTGSTTLPSQPVSPTPVWGYNLTNAPVTKPGGPTLTVTQGDPVVLLLHNQLSEATSLVVRGQSMPTDQTGVAPGGTKALHLHRHRARHVHLRGRPDRQRPAPGGDGPVRHADRRTRALAPAYDHTKKRSS